MFKCTCECGNQHTVAGILLRRGVSKSCGCLRREIGAKAGKKSRKHGHAGAGGQTPEYRAWVNMLQRCTNPAHRQWAHYGGRGIVVCDRWTRFEEFLADMGTRPSSGHSIDRMDNEGGYCPENCRWATSVQQNRNTRGNRNLEIDGTVRTMAEWCSLAAVSRSTVFRRLAKGFPPAQAVFGAAYRKRSYDDK